MIEDFVDKFVVYASENKELRVGKLFDEETPELITLKSAKIECNEKQEWIRLPETNKAIKEVVIRGRVPENTEDNICIVQFVARDNDKKSSRECSFEVTINIMASRFAGVDINAWPTDIKLDDTSPVILSSSANNGGLVKVNFDQDILVPEMIYNLTSENEGPSYFNLTLIIDPSNLINDDIPDFTPPRK